MKAGIPGCSYCSSCGQPSFISRCPPTSSSVSSNECLHSRKLLQWSIKKQRSHVQSLQAISVRGEETSGMAKGDRSAAICEEMDAGVGLRMRDDRDMVPGHVAIIMDGNHRWAMERGLPGAAGHRQGVETLRRTVVYCRKRGIRALTVFAFSTENWRRGHNETAFLLGLMEQTLLEKVHELVANGVRLRFVGDVGEMSSSLVETVQEAEKMTENNADLLLTVALNYSGRADIVSAAKRIAQRVEQGTVNPHEVNENLFAKVSSWTHFHNFHQLLPSLICVASMLNKGNDVQAACHCQAHRCVGF